MSTNQVEWRATRQPSSTVDSDLVDVEVVDNARRFANTAIINLNDTDGTKSDDYPRGQRVELSVSTDGGNSFTRRWAGFVQSRTDRAAAGEVEVDLVGYDHLLKRREVYKDYSSQQLSAILQDLVESFTAVTWNAANVSVQNDKTVTRSFDGERVDEAIREIASISAGESWGVNDDLEFFFDASDTERAETILDGEWLDYDLPEDGRRSVNRVRLFYGQGGNESSVIVEDREAQKDLKEKLGTSRRIVISASETYPNIDNETAAKDKADQILGERSVLLTGTVTTFDRFDTDPSDVFRLQISEKNIDTDFAVAQIEYVWSTDSTIITVVENRGEVEDLLVALSDQISRVSARDADSDAAFTRFLEVRSGVTLSITATLTTKETASGSFVLGQSQLGDGTDDTLGGSVASVGSSSVDTKKITRALLNVCRDVWQGESHTDLSHLAVGTDDSDATRADDSLESEVDRVSLEKYGAGGDTTVATAADSTTDWASGTNATLSTTSDPSHDGTSVQADTDDPNTSGNRFVTFDPSGTWDLSDDDRLEFWYHTDNAGGFHYVELRDSGNNESEYDFSDQIVVDEGGVVSVHLRDDAGTAGSGLSDADLSDITSIRWVFDGPSGEDKQINVDTVNFLTGRGASSFEIIATVPAGGVFAESTLRELGVFDAASGGTAHSRLTITDTDLDGSTRLKIHLAFSISNNSDIPGVIDDKGQERLRDLVVGETGSHPSTMLYGTGTTNATTSDTALETQVHSDSIDSTADRSTGISDIVERIGTGEANGNDLSEIGYENSSNELLARLVFEGLSKTDDFALESNYRFEASNA